MASPLHSAWLSEAIVSPEGVNKEGAFTCPLSLILAIENHLEGREVYSLRASQDSEARVYEVEILSDCTNWLYSLGQVGLTLQSSVCMTVKWA